MKAIDAGNNETKYYDGIILRKYPSDNGLDFRNRNLEQKHGEFDFVWEYAGKRGFAGTLAEESECSGSYGGDSKAHFDALLRILIALHQFSSDPVHEIIVGQPISKHNPEEKQAIKRMLMEQPHDITVNGRRKIISIRKCEVAAEGVVAGLLRPSRGIVRVIDIGSATVNYGTLKDMRFIDKDSWTETNGIKTFTHDNFEAIGRQISLRALKKFKKEDMVQVCGGGAELLISFIREVFPRAELVQDPVFANVRAFFEIARRVYG